MKLHRIQFLYNTKRKRSASETGGPRTNEVGSVRTSTLREKLHHAPAKLFAVTLRHQVSDFENIQCFLQLISSRGAAGTRIEARVSEERRAVFSAILSQPPQKVVRNKYLTQPSSAGGKTKW